MVARGGWEQTPVTEHAPGVMQIFSLSDENILELDSGDGCTTLLLMQKAIELYTQKEGDFILCELYLN